MTEKHEIVAGVCYDPQIKELYDQNMKTGDIAKALGLKAQYVGRRLAKMRDIGEINTPGPREMSRRMNDEIKTMYLAKAGRYEIAKRTGTNPTIVLARLNYMFKKGEIPTYPRW